MPAGCSHLALQGTFTLSHDTGAGLPTEEVGQDSPSQSTQPGPHFHLQ